MDSAAVSSHREIHDTVTNKQRHSKPEEFTLLASNEADLQLPSSEAAENDSKPQESNLLEPSRDVLVCNEVELQGPGTEAAESGIAWNGCTKNPGHLKFIPVSEFGLENLPRRNQTQDILSCIRDLSDLTVRLRVTWTSWERPDGDQFCTLRGKTLARLGTGWVSNVFFGDGPCPCTACLDNPTPCTEWRSIMVRTACHVVYNEEEAAATTVDVFYDDKRSKKDGRTKTLVGVGRTMSKNKDCDVSTFACFTHDIQLGARLFDAQRLGASSRFPEYCLATANGSAELRDASTVVVVSHPHGQFKHITLGEWVGLTRLGKDGEGGGPRVEFVPAYSEYRADTCPGSSGAPVVVLGPKSALSTLAQHSGYQKCKNLNYSAADYVHYPNRG